jgi:hypothetical protein
LYPNVAVQTPVNVNTNVNASPPIAVGVFGDAIASSDVTQIADGDQSNILGQQSQILANFCQNGTLYLPVIAVQGDLCANVSG